MEIRSIHPHSKAITVAQYGIGPIGAEIVRLMLTKPWLKLVAAIDNDPDKVGRDVGDVVGLGRAVGVIVTPELSTRAMVVSHSTRSRLAEIEPQLRALLESGCHVISTCEELAFPLDAELRESLQTTARSNGVTLLGTGINPGFIMDKLPLTLTSVCQDVRAVEVSRVVDASQRREPLQRKIGAGLTKKEFERSVADGTIRHMGLRESLMMVANGMDVQLVEVSDEQIAPVIAGARIATQFVTVDKGQVAGVRQTIRAKAASGMTIALDISVSVGATDPCDRIEIKGVPDISATIRGGIHGDRAAAAMVVNAIPRILNARPGLLSMDDIPVSYR